MNTQKKKSIKLFFKSLLITAASITIWAIGFFSAEYFFTKF